MLKHVPQVTKLLNHCNTLMFWPFGLWKKPGSLSTDCKYLHARRIPHQLSFHSQTVPDCIRYIICAFCYNFKSQTNILASYKHTSLCQSWDITHAQVSTLLIHCAESLRRSNVYIFYLWILKEHNWIKLTS